MNGWVERGGVFYWQNQHKIGVSLAKESLDLDQPDVSATSEPFKVLDPEPGEMYVLLLGSDTRSDEIGRADSLMIAHYNQKTKDIIIFSIMRDTYVDIPEYGKQKINVAFALDGIEVEVPHSMSYGGGKTLQPGKQVLHGDEFVFVAITKMTLGGWNGSKKYCRK